MNDFPCSKWYAVYVKSRQEKKVHQQLEEKELVSFLPLLETLRQWSDRKKKFSSLCSAAMCSSR